MDDDRPLRVDQRVGQPLRPQDREALLALLEYLKPVAHNATLEGNAIGRWLLASLLALNSGGIVATVRLSEVPSSIEVWGAGCWLAGIFLALGSGIIAVFNLHRGSSIVSTAVDEIIASLNLDRVPALNFQKARERHDRRVRWTPRLAIASAVAFLAGASVHAVAWLG